MKIRIRDRFIFNKNRMCGYQFCFVKSQIAQALYDIIRVNETGWIAYQNLYAKIQ